MGLREKFERRAPGTLKELDMAGLLKSSLGLSHLNLSIERDATFIVWGKVKIVRLVLCFTRKKRGV